MLLLYVYISVVTRSAVSQTPPTENGAEYFSQKSEAVVREIEKILSMYDGTMGLKNPDTKEQRCFQLNGHIGSVINRAISFCG